MNEKEEVIFVLIMNIWAKREKPEPESTKAWGESLASIKQVQKTDSVIFEILGNTVHVPLEAIEFLAEEYYKAGNQFFDLYGALNNAFCLAEKYPISEGLRKKILNAGLSRGFVHAAKSLVKNRYDRELKPEEVQVLVDEYCKGATSGSQLIMDLVALAEATNDHAFVCRVQSQIKKREKAFASQMD